jgi:hypothetical protein
LPPANGCPASQLPGAPGGCYRLQLKKKAN